MIHDFRSELEMRNDTVGVHKLLNSDYLAVYLRLYQQFLEKLASDLEYS